MQKICINMYKDITTISDSILVNNQVDNLHLHYKYIDPNLFRVKMARLCYTGMLLSAFTYVFHPLHVHVHVYTIHIEILQLKLYFVLYFAHEFNLYYITFYNMLIKRNFTLRISIIWAPK